MSQPARVLIINAAREGTDAPLGGIQKAILGQIHALLAQGVVVSLLSAAVRVADAARVLGCEVHYHPQWHNGLKPLIYPQLVARLLVLRRRRPCCVIHHSGRTWTYGRLFYSSIPQVVVMHRELVRPYRFIPRWLALSPGYAEQLRQGKQLGQRQIAWAPNALYHLPSLPGDRRSMPPSGSELHIGFAGRASEGKGLETLLLAMKALQQNGYRSRLHIAGVIDPWLYDLARELGLREQLTDMGWLEDLTPFYAAIDLLCLPSHKESFGLVLAEAMAAGVPVLASGCNGPGYLIKHGETGLLFDIGDAAELARQLQQAIEQPDRFSTMAQRAAKDVRIRFSPEPVGAALLQALGELGVHFGGASDRDHDT